MKIVPLQCEGDIPKKFRGGPIEKLVHYHNFKHTHIHYKQPEILIGKCMDYRVKLQLPAAFAYTLRTGGCNLRHNDFQVAYAIAVGGVKAIALIGHNDCGMVELENKREQFVSGLTAKSSWTHEQADDYFRHHVAEHTLSVETDILQEQADKYRSWFPMLPVALFLYRVDDHLLYLLQE